MLILRDPFSSTSRIVVLVYIGGIEDDGDMDRRPID
jgi:hypothetical protein